MDQVIAFDKSLVQRLNEYMVVFSRQMVSASQMKEVWAFYLELSLDPNGWQAVWKIPRLTCEALKIPFPTIVLVYVEDIDCKALAATIKILAVQDDISLPDKHFVPLINLWPTKEQDRTVALNIESSANSLDMLRFFYNNLFMPWDYEDGDSSDWVNQHLESRLRLFYDMKNGVIPQATSELIRSLIAEARRTQVTIERIVSALDFDDDDDLDLDITGADDKRVQKMMDLQVRIIEIRGEIEILENPVMRNVILKRQEELSTVKERACKKMWLILEGRKVEDSISFLQQVQLYHPNETVEFATNFKTVDAYDTVILSNTKHVFTTIGGLMQGGILKGIYDRSETTICSTRDDVMLDLSGRVELENLTINAESSQCAILVRKGKVTLKNCNLIGDGSSSTHQGIIVFDGNELELIDCNVTGFSDAIVGNSGSRITITNCKIHAVTYGIKVYENSDVTVTKSEFFNCFEYAFNVYGCNLEKSKIGNFNVLQDVPNITLQDVGGRDNRKADVIIHHKHSIKPVSDLFSVCESDSEDEMEYANELNDTVIDLCN